MSEQLNFFKILDLWVSPSKKELAQPIRKTKKSIKSKPFFTETIKFNGYDVVVQRRAFQRNINLMVPLNNKIKVTCSKSCSQKQIKSLLIQQEQWIEDSVNKHKKMQSKYPTKKFCLGESFLFKGEPHLLFFRPTRKKNYYCTWGEGKKLLIEVPEKEWSASYALRPHPELRDKVIQYYAKTGREVLTKKIVYWSQTMGVIYNKVSFRAQKYRWGSCSSQGNISLNWKLVATPEAVMDYVVIHELCHLVHQDHSKNFWKLVESFAPDYKRQKKWLRDHQYHLDFLNKVSEFKSL